MHQFGWIATFARVKRRSERNINLEVSNGVQAKRLREGRLNALSDLGELFFGSHLRQVQREFITAQAGNDIPGAQLIAQTPCHLL